MLTYLETGYHRPTYAPNVGTGYSVDRFGEEDLESTYPSQSQIWDELR